MPRAERDGMRSIKAKDHEFDDMFATKDNYQGDTRSIGSRNDYGAVKIPSINKREYVGPQSERAQTSESRRHHRTLNYYNTNESQTSGLQ